MSFKQAVGFILRVVAWCALIVWPSYLLQLSLATAFREHVTHPFSAALEVGLVGLPVVALASAAYGLLLVGVALLVGPFLARAVGVLAVAVAVQACIHGAGFMVFDTHPIPVGLGFVALVAVSLFEVSRLRRLPEPAQKP